jgi:hypothetical protein
MILPPRAVEIIKNISLWKKRPVKFQAFRHARGKKKKISRGDKPGEYAEKPQPKMLRKISC